MSYTPTNWKSGDIVSAEKLNKLEQGVAECGGDRAEPLIFTITEEDIPCPNDPSLTTYKHTYSHSWQEIHDALLNGGIVLYIEGDEYSVCQWRIFATYESDEENAPYHADCISFENSPYSWNINGMSIPFSSTTSKEYIGSCDQE